MMSYPEINFHPLCNYRPKLKSKQTNNVATMKSNISLFSRLYIANQRRAGDLDTFFSHENSSVPPSLSKDGMLRSGDKSDLIDCMIKKKKKTSAVIQYQTQMA